MRFFELRRVGEVGHLARTEAQEQETHAVRKANLSTDRHETVTKTVGPNHEPTQAGNRRAADPVRGDPGAGCVGWRPGPADFAPVLGPLNAFFRQVRFARARRPIGFQRRPARLTGPPRFTAVPVRAAARARRPRQWSVAQQVGRQASRRNLPDSQCIGSRRQRSPRL
jgi:hypothetical protein